MRDPERISDIDKERKRSIERDEEREKHLCELSEKMSKFDSLLNRFEIESRNSDSINASTFDDETKNEANVMNRLSSCERMMRLIRESLRMFEMVLKARGVCPETHEGLRKEWKRVDAYERKIERTNERLRSDRAVNNDIKKNDSKRSRGEDGEDVCGVSAKVANRFIRNALGGSRSIEENFLKGEEVHTKRKKIEDDAKQKLDSKVNEKIDRSLQRKKKGTTTKTKQHVPCDDEASE
jgi:hypothetical protein